MKKTLLISVICMATLLIAGDLYAQIIPNYQLAPGAGQRALTPDEVLVVETAIDYWEMLHPDVGPINIDFLFDVNVPPLAVACCYSEDGSGRPTGSLIRFSDQAGANWYIDATPTVDELNEIPCTSWDMLSTAIHEIGHSIGFTTGYSRFTANIGAALPDGRRPFSCGTVNATLMPAGDNHLDPAIYPGDLMVPALTSCTRRTPSQLNLAMLGCTFWYTFNTLPEVLSPNGGESFPAGCPITVTWNPGGGVIAPAVNILYSDDGGTTWVTLLTNTPNDGSEEVTLPCDETTQGWIKVEEAKLLFDISDGDVEVFHPEITSVGTVVGSFDPPNPWVQEGLVIDKFQFSADVDLFNVQFVGDPLQDPSVPCEGAHVKAIHGDMIEFVPEVIDYLPAGQVVEVEVKVTVPVGQHTGTYEGQVHILAENACECPPQMSGDIDVTISVLPQTDMDIADNDGRVSDNVMHLIGAKGDLLTGTFTVINPNSAVQNVDPADGPGNIRIVPVLTTISRLYKIGDPLVYIDPPTIGVPVSLASGEAQVITLEVLVPDGIPVNAVYEGTVSMEYESCQGGGNVSDEFTVQVEVLKTQGPLDIVEDELVREFCPPDPWIQVGQVQFKFDIHAYGDHRNVRVSSGGLEHEIHMKKLDDFNFFPEEFALISAGETKTARVIVKIPIGQHAGLYSGYFKVVSEDGGEDSVKASMDICPLYDLDIKDHYANLGDNVMVIPAYSRANESGGEWTLKAFDIGLPSALVNNHDEFDGPSNAPVDSVEYKFSEWSPVWHEDTHEYDLHNGHHFTGTAYLDGEFDDWESGEFRRILVGVFVPPMRGNNNHPGTYRGRLDCWAVVDGERVAHDYFEIEVDLARVIGSGTPTKTATTFGAEPTADGAHIYWGEFSTLGMTGPVNLYREDPNGGFTCIQAALAQASSYIDSDIDPKLIYNYRLGIERNGVEVFTRTVSVGGIPRYLELFPSFPNPTSAQTMIRYDMPKNGYVSIRIYDAAGRLVRTLKDGQDIAGFCKVPFDGRNDFGRRLASGVYYCHLSALNRTATQKIVITH